MKTLPASAENLKTVRESQVESLGTPTPNTDACNKLARFIEDLRDNPALISSDGFSRGPALTEAASAIRSNAAEKAKIKALVELLSKAAARLSSAGGAFDNQGNEMMANSCFRCVAEIEAALATA